MPLPVPPPAKLHSLPWTATPAWKTPVPNLRKVLFALRHSAPTPPALFSGDSESPKAYAVLLSEDSGTKPVRMRMQSGFSHNRPMSAKYGRNPAKSGPIEKHMSRSWSNFRQHREALAALDRISADALSSWTHFDRSEAKFG